MVWRVPQRGPPLFVLSVRSGCYACTGTIPSQEQLQRHQRSMAQAVEVKLDLATIAHVGFPHTVKQQDGFLKLWHSQRSYTLPNRLPGRCWRGCRRIGCCAVMASAKRLPLIRPPLPLLLLLLLLLLLRIVGGMAMMVFNPSVRCCFCIDVVNPTVRVDLQNSPSEGNNVIRRAHVN